MQYLKQNCVSGLTVKLNEYKLCHLKNLPPFPGKINSLLKKTRQLCGQCTGLCLVSE